MTDTNSDNCIVDERLLEYRKIQSNNLWETLNEHIKRTITKYGSVTNIKSDEVAPIDSQEDIDVINRLVQLKTFCIIPNINPATQRVTHIYTMGMWYYWGIPEILIKFEVPVLENEITFCKQIFLDIIHNYLYNKYLKTLSLCENNTKIKTINFWNEPSRISIENVEYSINLEIERVAETEYINSGLTTLLWFYMYYMKHSMISNGDDKELLMFPVYQTILSKIVYSNIVDKIVNKLYEDALKGSKDPLDEYTDSSDEL
jgi:hypothetical protein